MKRFIKVTALIAVLLVTFSMIGCQNIAGNNEPATTAVFTCTDEGLTSTLYYYANNTWKMHISGTAQSLIGNITCNYDDSTGTYTGNPAVDGECTITITKKTNDMTLLGLFFTAKSITNDNLPLEDVENPTPETITITNGSFTRGEATFKRK